MDKPVTLHRVVADNARGRYRGRRPAMLATLLLFLCGFGHAAFSEVTTDCGILGSFDGGFGQPNAVCAATDTGRGGTASASAGIGTLNADASVFSDLKGLTQATAVATWFDTMLITAPNVSAGSSGQLVFGYFLQGSLNATGHGEATAGLSFGSCDLALCSPGTGLAGFTVTETSGDPAVGVVGEHSTSFRFGEMIGISMSLALSAKKLEAFESPFSGSAEAHFTGTAYWGGILDVRQNGVSVPYTLVTGSGLDLTQSFRPVPLPAAGLMMFSGTAALIALARRKTAPG